MKLKMKFQKSISIIQEENADEVESDESQEEEDKIIGPIEKPKKIE